VRCYLPSTGTVLIVIVIGAALLRGPASHIAAGMGTIAVILAVTALVAGLFTGTILTARAIQRRRAAAGGCVSCRFQCQRAMTSAGAATREPACAASREPAPRRPLLVGIYTGEQQPPRWPQIAPANASAGSGVDGVDGVDGVAGTAQNHDRARANGDLIPT
jgi:hypothetical protein